MKKLQQMVHPLGPVAYAPDTIPPGAHPAPHLGLRLSRNDTGSAVEATLTSIVANTPNITNAPPLHNQSQSQSQSQAPVQQQLPSQQLQQQQQQQMQQGYYQNFMTPTPMKTMMGGTLASNSASVSTTVAVAAAATIIAVGQRAQDGQCQLNPNSGGYSNYNYNNIGNYNTNIKNNNVNTIGNGEIMNLQQNTFDFNSIPNPNNCKCVPTNPVGCMDSIDCASSLIPQQLPQLPTSACAAKSHDQMVGVDNDICGQCNLVGHKIEWVKNDKLNKINDNYNYNYDYNYKNKCNNMTHQQLFEKKLCNVINPFFNDIHYKDFMLLKYYLQTIDQNNSGLVKGNKICGWIQLHWKKWFDWKELSPNFGIVEYKPLMIKLLNCYLNVHYSQTLKWFEKVDPHRTCHVTYSEVETIILMSQPCNEPDIALYVLKRRFRSRVYNGNVNYRKFLHVLMDQIEHEVYSCEF